ncbi:copper resistance system multicopper oxidase [Aurantivibrio infirmus]
MFKNLSRMHLMSRRKFVLGASGAMLSSSIANTASAQQTTLQAKKFSDDAPILSGTEFNLAIDYKTVNFTGRNRSAVCINDSFPAPTLRWREGEMITINVTNNLDVDSSLHWHGLILPSEMDGVPGLSFEGIKPGKTFSYKFLVRQSGTYWYHSHSDYQEQLGLYGAIIIDPAEKSIKTNTLKSDERSYDREHLLLLSDWSDENPHKIYSKLKKQSHYYNTRERTILDTGSDLKTKGVRKTLRDRAMWNQMRMSDHDISDVTGSTYTFLTNGKTPEHGWIGEFNPGEKIRLRVINASAMTIFDFRIPGLSMKVIAADGQDVQSIDVEEFRIGVAETYDLIVEPKENAYTLFAQSIDRSGHTRGTLTTNAQKSALIPSMDEAPILQHRDMGMANHGEMNHEGMSHEQLEHGNHNSEKTVHDHGENNNHDLGLAGFGSKENIIHDENEFGPHVDMRVDAPINGISDPGIGLRNHQQRFGRRVLKYEDLKNLYPTEDKRQPSREIQLHLTGNMSRYMWSINGVKFADAEAIKLNHHERVRFVLVNDTMMTHPIHLHGLWSELETGDPDFIPRKHTILVQPGSTVSYLVTADALGRWAYHCHLLFHMAGMMREVRVTHNMKMNESDNHQHGEQEIKKQENSHEHG